MNASTSKELNLLIMAAGAARRFGSCKLLAPLQGKPVIAHCLDVFSEFSFNEVYVACGAYRSDITGYIEHHYKHNGPLKLNLIECKQWQNGLGHSIAEACRSINSNKPMLITLADLPFISHSDINLLLHQADLNPTKIIAAFNGQTLSPPVMFPTEYLDQLNHLSGDYGAKNLLNHYPDQVISLTLKNAAFDIDTQHQLEKANK